jgi:hypothetical protein
MKFNTLYFTLAVIVFIVEVVIALFVRDSFVRPYLGDVLVVILIYCSIKSILPYPVIPVAVAVLIFSFFIESLQYIRIIDKLGLQDSAIARTVIGTSFAWNDFIAYTTGAAMILIFESFRRKLVAPVRADDRE